ncbi:MAG: type 4a pilus biogenesis protein PilO [Syntrophorhabdales bacterium]|jgi:type IV pilus assembly protein PilO
MNLGMDLTLKGLTIPKKYRIALMLLLPALIIAGAYFLLFNTQLENKSRLRADIDTARQELARITAMRNNMGKARQDYARLKDDLQEKLRQMPEEKEVPNLLRQVSLAAQETKTRMKYFAPKEQKAQGFYWELPFEMKYSAPYHSIGYFFDGIRRLERIVHVTSFSLEAKEVGQKVILEGSCLAKTYVFMKEPEKEKAKQKTKEEKNVPGKI